MGCGGRGCRVRGVGFVGVVGFWVGFVLDEKGVLYFRRGEFVF